MEKIDALPLHNKLGIEEGFEVKLINEPDDFLESLNGFRNSVHFIKILNKPVDMIHLFTRSKKELMIELPGLKNFIKETGSLWVSWPKESSSNVSDLDENLVRDIGSLNGLVDSRVCSIDDNWSALKFIHLDKDRSK